MDPVARSGRERARLGDHPSDVIRRTRELPSQALPGEIIDHPLRRDRQHLRSVVRIDRGRRRIRVAR